MMMGGVCGKYGGEQYAYRISVGDLNGTDNLEDLGIDWKILKQIITKIGWK
jgi:hypothetical protein